MYYSWPELDLVNKNNQGGVPTVGVHRKVRTEQHIWTFHLTSFHKKIVVYIATVEARAL